jgi:hypothetical protein
MNSFINLSENTSKSNLGSICDSPHQCKSNNCLLNRCVYSNNMIYPGNVNQKCSNNNDCLNTLHCSNNLCKPKFIPGESCAEDIQCNSYKCDLDRCSYLNANTFLGEENQICNQSEDCSNKLYCNENNMCEFKFKPGHMCYDNSQCKSSNCKLDRCTYLNNNVYRGEENHKCDTSKDCIKNLFCKMSVCGPSRALTVPEQTLQLSNDNSVDTVIKNNIKIKPTVGYSIYGWVKVKKNDNYHIFYTYDKNKNKKLIFNIDNFNLHGKIKIPKVNEYNTFKNSKNTLFKLKNNQWEHITWVYNGENVIIYKNGEKIHSIKNISFMLSDNIHITNHSNLKTKQWNISNFPLNKNEINNLQNINV